jgi:hypothetical protein
MSISEKVYRFLIRAYSRDYRTQYADPMQQLFRDRLHEVRGFAELIVLWGRTLADWVVSVPASYWGAGTLNNPFSSFGNPARNCIFFARCEAYSFACNEVTVNHLLLGVLRQQRVLVPEAVLETMVRTIEAEEPLGRRVPLILHPHSFAHRFKAFSTTVDSGEVVGPGEIELGEEALRVVTAATDIAHTQGRKEVVPADLATAILQGTDGLAACLLRQHLSEGH